MTITERQAGSIVVLGLSGKLTSDDTGVLKNKVTSLMEAGSPNIVLDLGELTYMDSSGLGQMVGCHSTVKGKGEVKLANVGKRIQDLLIMTKLHMVFDTYDSESEAVASFAKST